MNLTLTRFRITPLGAFGELRSADNTLYLKTLEHVYEDGSVKIPSGVYTCVRRKSPHFGYDLFMLVGVPAHEFIEIHIGNFNADSDGCILVGMGSTLVSITNSKAAFEALMKTQEGVDEFTLTVKDAIA